MIMKKSYEHFSRKLPSIVFIERKKLPTGAKPLTILCKQVTHHDKGVIRFGIFYDVSVR